MTPNTDFRFKDVLVVTREEDSAFVDQLKKHEIDFSVQRPRKGMNLEIEPDLILIVNAGLETIAIPLKQKFPDAQVVVCTENKGKHIPNITFVFNKEDWDVRYFRNLDEFIELIGNMQTPLPKVFRSSHGKPDHYDLVAEVSASQDTTQDMAWMFSSMSAMSEAYLEWFLKWQTEVSNLLFDCHFGYKTRGSKLRKLSFEVTEEFTYKGLPVFSVDDTVFLHTATGDFCEGVVDFIDDEEMTVKLTRKMTRKQVNGLRTFQIEVEPHLTEKYLDLCKALSAAGNHSHPRLAIAGVVENNLADPISQIYLSRPQWRKLNQDRSQQLALASICSSQNLTFVHGPAGTGKTFLTALAVEQFLQQGKVTLLISHSNQGLNNLTEAVAQNIDDRTRIHRLGNNTQTISSSILQYHRSTRYSEEFQMDDILDTASSKGTISQQEARDIIQKRESGGVVLACTMASFLIDRTLQELRRNGDLDVDVVFVDEASRGFFYELLPIVSAARERVVFIGDPDQLGNIDISRDAKAHLTESGFSDDEIDYFSLGWFNAVLKEKYMRASLLEINRRSLPVICDLVSELFYNGCLFSGRFNPDDDGQVIFYDTADAQGKEDKKVRTSRCNKREANIAVKYILRRLKNGVGLDEIAIITPYRAQINLIRQKLRKAFLFDAKLKALRSELGIDGMGPDELNDFLEELLESVVNTVDAFQGSQKKEIILSFVCSNAVNDIGFNRNINRLRVAMSRAEDRLVVIADSSTFLKCDFPEVSVLFTQIIAYIKENGLYEKIGVAA